MVVEGCHSSASQPCLSVAKPEGIVGLHEITEAVAPPTTGPWFSLPPCQVLGVLGQGAVGTVGAQG